jgi:hypothetical protein
MALKKAILPFLSLYTLQVLNSLRFPELTVYYIGSAKPVIVPSKGVANRCFLPFCHSIGILPTIAAEESIESTSFGVVASQMPGQHDKWKSSTNTVNKEAYRIITERKIGNRNG